MANVLYGNTLYCDTPGIISKSPIRIRAIEVDPSAAAGLVLFNWWDEARPIANTKQFLTGTITGTNTLTATGLLTSIYADGSVIKIFPVNKGGGDGSVANMTYHLIGTAGDNDAIVTAETSLTNETAKTYLLEAYPARKAFSIATPGTEVINEFRYFGEHGVLLPNLTMELATNAVAIVYLADLAAC